MSWAVAVMLVSASAAQDPPFHYVPPAALEELSKRADHEAQATGTGGRSRGRRGCGEAAGPDEIVVCGDSGALYRVENFPDAPEAPTFTGRRGEDSAFEQSRCAVLRCPPEAKIDVIRGARLIARGLRAIFGGDD